MRGFGAETGLVNRAPRHSESLRAVRCGQHRVERGRAADVETVSLRAAEDEVGAGLRDEDLADEGAVRVVAMDAVAGAGPEAAGDIEAETVEEPARTARKDL